MGEVFTKKEKFGLLTRSRKKKGHIMKKGLLEWRRGY